MRPLINLRLVANVPTVMDAEEQVAMLKDMLQESEDPERTKELHVAVCRATMILNTKRIELSPEQQAELRELGRAKKQA